MYCISLNVSVQINACLPWTRGTSSTPKHKQRFKHKYYSKTEQLIFLYIKLVTKMVKGSTLLDMKFNRECSIIEKFCYIFRDRYRKMKKRTLQLNNYTRQKRLLGLQLILKSSLHYFTLSSTYMSSRTLHLTI